ncbi:E3 SUMO-protein ligase SIZ1 isoform X1 [Vigna angularis]|uniref:E3 SUMO-protein ligase SIZ1 isoform X1 n=2 Tax=Phaseolus angularis TaxID=3914 RepID=UPI000809B468|nr:E3 SUMO-protein ligase SIZ1 isoform X1 [Vigna angularis]XP_017424822.1 E3 SUMO-protein ligase SIZ1 isoform X1 [Vigna angularis]
MDLVASCKEKLQYFRLKELKDVLTQLGLSKQGKKQDLVDRILSILSEDQACYFFPVSKLWIKKNAVGKQRVAKLVEDTYRKLQVSGAIDLSSKGQGSDSSNVKIKNEMEDSFLSDTKIRCLCGNVLDTDPLVKCADTRCHVSQHINCVVIPEKPTDGTPHVPDKFYCEICRVDRADPFCVSVTHLLFPVKLTTTNIPTDGTSPVQSVERTFQLTKANKELVSKPEYDVQAWCMLLNDKVSFRMQWPQYTDLKVNGLPVRAINRPGSQVLGPNGRDSGSVITPYSKDGINRISLTVVDARIFCLGVRIIKRLTVPEILSMIPEEPNGESFEDALARVCCCVGGGNANDNADSDSDLEVVSDTFSINLRCPMSGSRMKIAGRFKPCVHMGCFDLEVFVELNERSRKWQCPICLKNYALENIIIDPYFNRITTLMKNCGEEITEVEVKPDGFWRVKVKNESERRELGTLAHWHRPDGSLFVSTDEINKMENLKLKQEGVSDGHIGLKLRKNSNGVWEVSKPENTNTSSGNNRLNEDLENIEHVIIPMSSSDTGSGRDEDDPSVNQGGGGHIDYSTTNGIEIDSVFNSNIDSAYGYSVHNASAPIGDAEVIVISDSEEDNDVLMSPTPITGYTNNQTSAAVDVYSVLEPGILDSYTEDPNPGGNASLGVFNSHPSEDDFGMSSLWPLQSGTPAVPGFQLFSSEVEDVSDTLVGLQSGNINCSSSLNGYMLAPDTALGSSTLMPDSSVARPDDDLNGGLVDNPLAFPREDPSLQIFLPTKPAESSIQHELSDHADISNGVFTEDWITLSLGGGASGRNGDASTATGLNSRPQIASGEGASNSLTDTAPLHLGINDVRSDKANGKRSDSDSPFSFPRQKRSEMEDDVVRHLWYYFSIGGEGVGCKVSQFFMLDIQVVHMT